MEFKDMLKYYASIKRQLKALDNDLKDLEVSKKAHVAQDMVKGSDVNFPYKYHSISLHGFELSDDEGEKIAKQLFNMRIRRKDTIVKFAKLADLMENFLNNIEEIDIREIFQLRYVAELTWEEMSKQTGDVYSPDGLRKKHDRYLLKIK